MPMRRETPGHRFKRARKNFRHYWGFEDFREHQEQAVRAACARKDVLNVTATGGGKSVCFQVPAITTEGTTIVFSPLISLMQDQVHDLNEKGIKATYINSTLSDTEQKKRLRKLSKGLYQLVYIAPERIRAKSFMRAIRDTHINYVGVDEAHSISLEGIAFRPSYLRIAEFLNELDPRPPVIAVTATATATVAQDLAESLELSNSRCEIFSDPIRENLSYEVIRCQTGTDDAQDKLLDQIARRVNPEDGRYIIYGATQKTTEALSNLLTDFFGIQVPYYHGGMTSEDRHDVQERFKSGEYRVIVATNAFGMGIDVPDIRGIIHLGIPNSLEQYSQEVGRAGRDGKPSFAILVEDPRVYNLREWFFEQANPSLFVYKLIWDHLHKVVDQSESSSIKVKTSEIADVVEEEGKKERRNFRVTNNMVEAALNALEAFGAISTQYGRPYELYEERGRSLDTAPGNAETEQFRAVARRMKRKARSPRTPGAGNFIVVNSEELSRETKVPAAVVDDVIRWLRRTGAIKHRKTDVPVFIDLTHYGSDLQQAIDHEQIELKYTTDSRRLKSMQQYVTLATEDDRIQHIRDYFDT